MAERSSFTNIGVARSFDSGGGVLRTFIIEFVKPITDISHNSQFVLIAYITVL